jgi:hypothetical protein
MYLDGGLVHRACKGIAAKTARQCARGIPKSLHFAYVTFEESWVEVLFSLCK